MVGADMLKDLMYHQSADFLKKMKGIYLFFIVLHVVFLFYFYILFFGMLLFRLFMGTSQRTINIESIRLMKGSVNLQTVIRAITALDICISEESSKPSSYNHGETLGALFGLLHII